MNKQVMTEVDEICDFLQEPRSVEEIAKRFNTTRQSVMQNLNRLLEEDCVNRNIDATYQWQK